MSMIDQISIEIIISKVKRLFWVDSEPQLSPKNHHHTTAIRISVSVSITNQQKGQQHSHMITSRNRRDEKSQLTLDSLNEHNLSAKFSPSKLDNQKAAMIFSDVGQDAKVIPIFQKSPLLYRQLYFLRGLLGLVGGLMIHLVIGSLYQWGLINAYYTSFFRLDEEYSNLTMKQNAIVFPITMFSLGTTMNLGLLLAEKYGPSLTIALSTTLCSAVVFLSSFARNLGRTSRPHYTVVFVFLYAVLFGAFLGVSFMIPMKVCNEYFPNRQPYVNGFILIGTGTGQIVFGMYAVLSMNPQQIIPPDGYFDDELAYIARNVPETIRQLAVGYFLFGLCGALFLYPVQKFNKNQAVVEKTIISRSVIKRINNEQSGSCLSAAEAFRCPLFYLHILIIVLSCCGNLFINTNFKIYVHDTIDDDQFLVMIAIVGALANGFSRMMWGVLFTHAGYKIIMLTLLSLNSVCLTVVRFTVENQFGYMALIFVFNLILGGFFVLAPTFSVLVFGREVGPKIFGIFWCSFALGNFLQYSLGIGLEPYIGIDGVVYICLCFNVLTACIVIRCKFLASWGNSLKCFQMAPIKKSPITQFGELLIYSVLANRAKNLLENPEISDQDSNRSTIIESCLKSSDSGKKTFLGDSHL